MTYLSDEGALLIVQLASPTIERVLRNAFHLIPERASSGEDDSPLPFCVLGQAVRLLHLHLEEGGGGEVRARMGLSVGPDQTPATLTATLEVSVPERSEGGDAANPLTLRWVDSAVDLDPLPSVPLPDTFLADAEMTLELGSLGPLPLRLAEGPVALRLLPSGNLSVAPRLEGDGAAGSTDVPGDLLQAWDTVRFRTHTTDVLQGTDSALALLLCRRFFEALPRVLRLDEAEKVRNVDLSLEAMDARGAWYEGTLEVEGPGLISGTRWYPVRLRIQVAPQVVRGGTPLARVELRWMVREVRGASLLTHILLQVARERIRDALSSDGRGAQVLLDPASWGDPDDLLLGNYAAVDARSQARFMEIRMTGGPRPVHLPEVELRIDRTLVSPSCDGSRGANLWIAHTSSPSDDAAMLSVCGVRWIGSGMHAFRPIRPGGGSLLLAPGETELLGRAELLPQAPPGLHEAEIEVDTSAGVFRVPVRGYSGAPLAPQLPGELVLDGEQIRAWCARTLENQVTVALELETGGTGAVMLCGYEIRDSTGGSWHAAGLDRGIVLVAGTPHTATITFRAEVLDQWEEATLVIFIQGTMHGRGIALRGRVRRAAEGFLAPPPGTRIAGFDFQAFGIDGDRLCFEHTSLQDALAAWSRLSRFLGEVWRDLEPDCCPPPAQPRCLCVDGFHVSLTGLPAGLRSDLVAGSVSVAQHELPAGDSHILGLLPSGVAPDWRVSGAPHEEGGTGPLVGTLTRWTLTRTNAWEGSEKLIGAGGLGRAGDRIALVSHGAIRILALEENDLLREAGTLELPLPPVHSVVQVGGRLLLTTSDGLFALDAEPPETPGGKPQVVSLASSRGGDGGSPDTPWSVLLDPAPWLPEDDAGDPGSPLPRRLVGGRPGEIHLLDVYPTGEVVRQAAGATEGPLPSLVAWCDHGLLLAGQGGVSLHRIGPRGDLPMEGETLALAGASPRALLALGSNAWLVDDRGQGHVLGMRPGWGIQRLGSFRLPSAEAEALPFGALGRVRVPGDPGGHRLVGLNPSGSGVRLVRLTRARSPRVQ